LSLSKKMTLLIVVFFISAVSLTALNYSFTAGVVKKRVEEAGLAQVTETAHTFDEYFSKLVSMTSALAASAEALLEAAPSADLEPLFLRYLASSRDEGIKRVFMGFEDGKFTDTSGESPPGGYDPRTRPWYKETAEKGRPIVTLPYADLKTGDQIISIAAPVRDSSGALAGVFAMNVDLSHVKKRVEQEKVFGEGYGFLTDGRGALLTSSLRGELPERLPFPVRPLPHSAPEKTFHHGTARSEAVSFEGGSHILFYAAAGEYFTYGLIYPEASFRRFVLEIALHHLLGWLIILALGGALFMPAVRELGKSLNSLASVADSFAERLSIPGGPGDVLNSVKVLADEIGGAERSARAPEFRRFLGSLKNALGVIGRQGVEIVSLTDEALYMQDNLLKTNQELLERQRIWRSTLNVMETISRGGKHDAKLNIIADAIRKNAGAFGVLLADCREGVMSPLAASGYRNGPKVDPLPLCRASVAGRAMKEMRPIWVEDVTMDPDYYMIHPEVVSEVEIPLIHRGKGVGILEVAFAGTPVPEDGDLVETLTPVASAIAGLLDVLDAKKDIKESYRYLTEKLRSVTEIYHLETGDHMDRIGAFSRLAAAALGRSEEEQNDVEIFSRLHDLGKLKVPMSILGKNGPLASKEMDVIKMHPQWGAELIGDARWLQMARNICLTHHEKWDGSGYPLGLAGDAIPWEGQVVALADVYDALRSNRIYKAAMSHEEAVKVILEGDGRTSPDHFSPEMLEFFRGNHREMDKIFNRLNEND
jgi:HD-GYP domain-containing protein (c-di-GMP phosphodiesterase class II)